ncbi:helix-turn-helix domain-containing protein [Maribellus comscasis]|uniref:Helix-turn-helix domain-containing protein n=1 Tax=Maribellus comscasis TaxID=2681766 RepID=A0A6I6K244_9BACT|nr:AraC family transcriptional regulator [Maribellus comscasis]QGY46502.1 helix-turn-helix domain-containing protein [Maribellus comscasis]
MIFSDKKFYKYLTIGEEDKRWGIYLTGAGNIMIDKQTEYPLIDDPSHHYFHWSIGRRISDYQILYITKGKGIFESEITGTRKINAGDIFILFPGIWHRFKPDEDSGWDEYWVEFNGDLIQHYRLKEFLSPENPVITVGIHEDIARNYLQVIHLLKEEKPGFQYIASGYIVQILGQIFASKKYHPFEGKAIENQIRQAKLTILENLHQSISQQEIARSAGMGYSLFRKKFKEYTGVSPAQYQIQLKINKAKDLLIVSDKPLKNISHNLGFDTFDYFCRQFKQKTGFTPSEFREKNKR